MFESVVHTAVDEVYLENTTFSNQYISRPVALVGNAANLSSLVINKAGIAAINFNLDGTYDLATWFNIVSQSTTTWGYLTSSSSGLQYAFLRVRVGLSPGVANKAFFSCFISMAEL